MLGKCLASGKLKKKEEGRKGGREGEREKEENKFFIPLLLASKPLIIIKVIRKFMN